MTRMTLKEVVARSKECHFCLYDNAEKVNDYKAAELIVWQPSGTIIW